jgi:hypothetical protein
MGLLVGVVWLCAAWIAVSTVRAVWDSRLPLPFWDQWDNLEDPASLRDWFVPHNEHRIAVPRVVFALDRLLVRGDNRLLLVAILLVQAGHVALLWRVLVSSPGVSRSIKAVLAGLALAVLFSLLQLENLAWGFQIGFVGVFFLGTAASFTVVHAAEREQRGTGSAGPWVLATCGLAAVATCTVANGVLVGLVVAGLGLWLRLARRWLAMLGGAALALPVWYFWDFRPARPPAGKLVAAVGGLAAYAAAYIGAPVSEVVVWGLSVLGAGGETSRVPVAVAAGAIGLACLPVVLWIAGAGQARKAPASVVVLSGVATFAAASALVTALGRLHLFSVEQAMASRYATAALVYWISVGSLVFLLGERPQAATWAPLRLCVVVGAAAASLALAGYQGAGIEKLWGAALWLQEAKLAVVADLGADDLLGRLHPNPSIVRERVERLRAEHRAVFAEPWPWWLGSPLQDHVTLRPASRCLGHFDRSDPVPESGGGVRVAGWAWDLETGTEPARIVLADAQGIVVGFAEPGYRRPDVPRVHAVAGPRAGWVGYVRDTGRDPVTAYVILRKDRGACPLPGRRPVRRPRSRSRRHGGRPRGARSAVRRAIAYGRRASEAGRASAPTAPRVALAGGLGRR